MNDLGYKVTYYSHYSYHPSLEPVLIDRSKTLKDTLRYQKLEISHKNDMAIYSAGTDQQKFTDFKSDASLYQLKP